MSKLTYQLLPPQVFLMQLHDYPYIINTIIVQFQFPSVSTKRSTLACVSWHQ